MNATFRTDRVDPLSLDLARATLATAVGSFATFGVPLKAFVMLEIEGERELHWMAARRLEDGAARARIYAASRSDADAAAFAIDAVISYQGVDWEGVVVESWNFDLNDGVRLGVRYGVKGRRKKAFPIGRPLALTSEGWVELR